MTHLSIEENNIAERYLTGKLSAEEEAGFEEHFIDCEECLDRLKTTNRFRRALRTAVAQDAGYAMANAVARTGRLAKVASLSKTRRAALAGIAILLIAGLPSILYVMEIRRVHAELDRLRRESTD